LRLIKLYTFKGDVVLDPFCGSGTSCIAGLKSERNYIGYDIENSYVELSERRIKEFVAQGKLF
jgi:modification methylase